MSRPEREPAHHLYYLPPSARAVLDVGCNVGELLADVQRMGVRQLYGVEINPAAAERARQRLAAGPGEVRIVSDSAERLPFPDASMDVVFCMEVLEHMPEPVRAPALAEMHRVLVPGGRLVMSVPFAGLFAGLDPANFRFHFPGLYRWASRRLGGRGREAGFASGEAGVVWHHHFTLDELRALLTPHFTLQQLRWRGSLIAPLGHWLEWPFYRLGRAEHPVMKGLQRLIARDYETQYGERLAYDVLLVAERAPR